MEKQRTSRTESEQKELELYNIYKERVKVAAMTVILLEKWEVLKTPKWPQRTLKYRANLFIKEMEKELAEAIAHLYNTEEEIFVAIQNSFEKLLEKDIMEILKESKEYDKLPD